MKIVALDVYTVNPGDNPLEPIESLGELITYERSSIEQIVDRSIQADILMINKTPISAETIAELPNLKYIAVTATGYNVVDGTAARQRNIPVSNVPEYSTQSVAQHVFAMILSRLHQPANHDTAIRNGTWQQRGDFAFWLAPVIELSGQTIGIVGLGRIGQAVARLAVAFGMNVNYHNPNKKLDVDPAFQWLPLDELLATSDIVSLHCPQIPHTEEMVNEEFVSKMKSTALLVNASRGGLINEAELARALNDRVIAGACLDVVAHEPILDSNPLLTAANCLLTPHMAWASLRARQRLVQITANNIRAFQSGEPINIVN